MNCQLSREGKKPCKVQCEPCRGVVSESMGVNTKPAHQIDLEGYWVLIDSKAPIELIEKLKMAIAIHLP